VRAVVHAGPHVLDRTTRPGHHLRKRPGLGAPLTANEFRLALGNPTNSRVVEMEAALLPRAASFLSDDLIGGIQSAGGTLIKPSKHRRDDAPVARDRWFGARPHMEPVGRARCWMGSVSQRGRQPRPLDAETGGDETGAEAPSLDEKTGAVHLAEAMFRDALARAAGSPLRAAGRGGDPCHQWRVRRRAAPVDAKRPGSDLHGRAHTALVRESAPPIRRDGVI
jgi:hypothetical protein